MPLHFLSKIAELPFGFPLSMIQPRLSSSATMFYTVFIDEQLDSPNVASKPRAFKPSSWSPCINSCLIVLKCFGIVANTVPKKLKRCRAAHHKTLLCLTLR